ncbi:DUF3016 domain-containing protein [Rubrivivax benzoatilyticus]|uniref:DUF3016 domain-containing protein n=1 Tax=Rubrivivax benzoatilyticus TaxID=316997 RepID=A0ABX0HSU9_9BURK|nr:DUF3016 domain-containing protein [Rubrivivax benzoatilyticus]NHK98122.1 DUF3016 domain-containing protein [Rubrivivax benzoatilyticus]NHL23624.1 DUF3016 domain-containing protein [Rubrivivax benzoatilyticus]
MPHLFPIRHAALGAALALAALAGPAQAAGVVQVSFVEPERYTDVGFGAVERERTTDRLAAIFQDLARRLPDGQVLTVEVLDVDLAGHVPVGNVNDTRVLTGGADWPRITLRYRLEAGGSVQTRDETVSDLNYLQNRLFGGRADEALAYERRMLERWFEARFLTP